MHSVTGCEDMKLCKASREAVPRIPSLPCTKNSSDSFITEDESIDYVIQRFVRGLSVNAGVATDKVAVISRQRFFVK